MCCRFFWGGLADLILWKKTCCLHYGGVWLHHMQLSLATFLTSLRRVNQTESSTVFFSICARVCVCARARVCFSGVWDRAITKPDLLGSDLLFFTSPTYQPPASVAVKRNGWYFRGELLFPFLAPVFFFILSCCDRARIHHRWAGTWQTSFERLPHLVPAMFF